MAARSIADIRLANGRAGYHFFDPETIQHWDSIAYMQTFDAGDKGTTFITSEAGEGWQRRYAVAVSRPDGSIRRVTRMCALPTFDMAELIASAVAHWWKTDTGPLSGTVDEWVARTIDSVQ